jgi:DNA-directed RNA polymerase specialized sigma24 family protein
MKTSGSLHDEDLARRVYSYFVFRLRQPADAERLTRLAFERLWNDANLGRGVEGEPDLPVFRAARAVISENPRRRGATRVTTSHHAGKAAEGGATGLSNELAIAIGRLHGRERDALALRFGAELSVGEMAELLDRTPADIKQRLARGTRMLIQLGVLPSDSGDGSSAAERPGARRSEQGESEQREPQG